MALKFRKRVILAKIESSYGTDSTPTGAANAILVHDLQIRPLIADTVSRDLVRPTLGNDLAIHVGSHVGVEFNVELAGAGAAGTAPAYGPLLRGCAMAQTVNSGVSVVYEPVSSGEESLTIYFHLDGQKHVLTGARGTWSFALTPNGIPRMRFSFLGLWNDPGSAADPTPDFSDFIAPIVVSNANTPTFNLHSADQVMYGFEFAMANQISHIDLVNEDSVRITDRQPNGNCTIDAPALSTKDWFADAKAGSTGALQIVHGTVAGNIIQFDATTVQVLQPNYGDSDGRATIGMSLGFIPSDAGDDEFSLTVK